MRSIKGPSGASAAPISTPYGGQRLVILTSDAMFSVCHELKQLLLCRKLSCLPLIDLASGLQAEFPLVSPC